MECHSEELGLGHLLAHDRPAHCHQASKQECIDDTLYEISDPRSPKYVLSLTPCTQLLTVPALPQCIYAAHLSKEQVADLVAPQSDLLALWYSSRALTTPGLSTTVYTPSLRLTVTRRWLADGRPRARIPSQRSLQRIVPALPARRNERDVHQLSAYAAAHSVHVPRRQRCSRRRRRGVISSAALAVRDRTQTRIVPETIHERISYRRGDASFT
jgi:hypothetical protein